MRPYSKPVLREFWTRHPQAEIPLRRWWKTVSVAEWKSLADVRRTYPYTDLVKGGSGDKLVFNVGGNDYRLVVLVRFGNDSLFILWVGTHAEYDRLIVRDL